MRGWWLAIYLLASLPLNAQVDSSFTYTVGQITVQGNHTTKNYIIQRELSFNQGDTITLTNLEEQVERSKDNVFNLGLFHSVSILHSTKNEIIEFTVIVAERWYIWPFPILENADRNFNTWWQNKDFDRLSYGVFLDWRNFRGRNEKLRIRVKTGFEQTLNMSYSWPFINQSKTIGLSISTGYTTNKEVNVASEENKQVFIKDENTNLRERYFVNTTLLLRQKLYTRHSFTFGMSSYHVSDTIQNYSQPYLNNGAAFNSLIYLSYLFKFDKRDYIDYPLTGSVFEFLAVKQGIGLLENDGLNLLELKASWRKHYQMSKKWFGANSIQGMSNVLDNPTYAYQRGLGFNNNFIRGYELYVMDAQHYLFNKNNIKWELIRPNSYTIEKLKLEKFNTISYAAYLNLFCDIGYAFDELYDQVNPLSNNLLIGYGIGLDIVTYYDIVFRSEYSFTKDGENGLFLHFKKSI
jgi:outer membrane protein assembly factor BamA